MRTFLKLYRSWVVRGRFLGVLAILVAFFAYSLVGVTLLVLAGGMSDSVGVGILAYMFWPFPALLIFVSVIADSAIRNKDAERKFRPGLGTFVVSLFFLLPIIMNGASMILQRMGWSRGAKFFFENRWMSQSIVILAFLALLIVIAGVDEIRNRLRKQFRDTYSRAVPRVL